jgi:hypothetical protein
MDAQLAEPVAVAPPSDPWLARRLLTVGASEVAVAMVIAGLAHIDDLPSYSQPNAKIMKAGGKTAPRLVLEKARLKRPLAVSEDALIGARREAELLSAWGHQLARGTYHCDAEALIQPASVGHASLLPKEWMPLLSRGCRGSATPDAWARDIDGSLVNVQLKCCRQPKPELPWYWRAQVVAECDVTCAEWGLLVCGVYWSISMTSRGPIVAWPVEPTPAETERIRSAVRHFWTLVDGVKGDMQ